MASSDHGYAIEMTHYPMAEAQPPIVVQFTWPRDI
jgi:hypothetical protein